MIRVKIKKGTYSVSNQSDSDGLFQVWVKEREGNVTYYLIKTVDTDSAIDVTSGGKKQRENFERMFIDPAFVGFDASKCSVDGYIWFSHDQIEAEIEGEALNEHFLGLLKKVQTCW